jgi:hypothetical protein
MWRHFASRRRINFAEVVVVVLHRIQVVLVVLVLEALSGVLLVLRHRRCSCYSGAAGSVTQSSAQSDAATASQSSLGTLPCILDSGASFHMTPDRTSLSSISPSSLPITVQTADGSSLSVAGQGTLLSPSFHVPAVSYVPKLTMQLISAGQLTDHGCRVILDSDSCCIQDRTGLLVGTGPRRRDSQLLWELDWLRLPSTASASLVGSPASTSSTSSFA